jgi:mannitol/fructose-specific phosphotransferase system IIA component (Ntr-type)
MKRYLMVFIVMFVAGVVHAQDPVSAQKGVTYGSGTNKEGDLVSSDLLPSRIQQDKYVGKITGKVVEVCQEKGFEKFVLRAQYDESH